MLSDMTAGVELWNCYEAATSGGLSNTTDSKAGRNTAVTGDRSLKGQDVDCSREFGEKAEGGGVFLGGDALGTAKEDNRARRA